MWGPGAAVLGCMEVERQGEHLSGSIGSKMGAGEGAWLKDDPSGLFMHDNGLVSHSHPPSLI